MKRLQRFNEIDALKALRDGHRKGYWTVEQLDSPPPGTRLAIEEWKRHPMNKNLKLDPPCYRNLLREVEDNQEPDFVL